MAFTVKYFPHYDSHLQGERAARMLVRAVRGDYRPETVTVKVPIVTPTVLQWTGASPWTASSRPRAWPITAARAPTC